MANSTIVCTRCVMDSTDPDIRFDEAGRCNHCNTFFRSLAMRPSAEVCDSRLQSLVRRIKRHGRNSDYDCVVGLSGGCDSSFLVFKVIELGLRPLVVHFDSGWNSELAVQNIERVINFHGLDLYTVVCDWEEMKGLQRSFFRASVVNCDIPQDHAFIAALNQVAAAKNIRYWISGHDYFGSESILAAAWRGYDSRDWLHIKGVHKQMGGAKLRNYPHSGLFRMFFLYPVFYRIRAINLFLYMNYNKLEAKRFLEATIGWRDYTGKHNESVFTRFFQGYYLPRKFSFDKRKAHLSSLIVSGQLTRDESLKELQSDFYGEVDLQQDKEFVLKKLGISESEWTDIMRTPPRDFSEFPNNHWFFDYHKRYRTFLSAAKRFVLRRVR